MTLPFPQKVVIPAQAGIHGFGRQHTYILPEIWFPACAGMTNVCIMKALEADMRMCQYF